MKWIMLSLFIFAGGVPGLAQSSSLPQTIKQLRQCKTDGPDSRIPAAARPLLTQLKRQLLDVISETIQSPEHQRKLPIQLQRLTRNNLAKLGIKVGGSANDRPNEYVYGDIHDITIRHPVGHFDLLTVTTTIGVCCGEDTSLYVFQKQHSRWQLVLQQEANGYEEVDGAQGSFRYAISPLDRNRHFFVVTARVTPWCTSAWQGLYYKVLRPGSQPASPKVLLSSKEIVYLGTGIGNDLGYVLKLIGNNFTLRFDTEATDKEREGGYVSHSLLLRYAVKGNHVKKLRSKTWR